MGHRRTSSSASGVFNIADLGKCSSLDSSLQGVWRTLNPWVQEANQGAEKEGKELEIAKETQKLNWCVLVSLNKKIAAIARGRVAASVC